MAQLQPRVLTARGWVLHSTTFPLLDVAFCAPGRRELRLQLTCDDWHDSPPSAALLAPDGSALTALPTLRPGNRIFNGSPHPRTRLPFVCMVGIREYHDHPSHRSDLWTHYKARDSYTLGNIVEKLWHGWARVWP